MIWALNECPFNCLIQEVITTLIILAIAAGLFVSGKVRSDLVAICSLLALLICQILTPAEGLAGFANSTVIKTGDKIEYFQYAIENEEQEIITDIIYEKIKKGEPANIGLFLRVVDKLKALGCEKIILGCTELSLLKRNYKLGSDFIDSMEVLAASAIKLCGKETIGFDTELESFTPTV